LQTNRTIYWIEDPYMNISKARLIQIIKEELAQEATPDSGGITARGTDLTEMDFVQTREDLERMIGDELVSLLKQEGK